MSGYRDAIDPALPFNVLADDVWLRPDLPVAAAVLGQQSIRHRDDELLITDSLISLATLQM